jgi:hypothetical protein
MKLNESYQTEFYISDMGYLVIKQESYEHGKVVKFLITPEQTKIFFNHLPKLMQQQAQCWTGVYNPQGVEDV